MTILLYCFVALIAINYLKKKKTIKNLKFKLSIDKLSFKSWENEM